MANTIKRDNPLIVIHMKVHDKNVLRKLADKQGMQLATLCRSILLKALENEAK